MRYWVTTHWPLREGGTEDAAVWLPDGRESAGDNLRVDDRVIVYESGSGRTQLIKHPGGSTTKHVCRPGREGVVYHGRVIEPLHADSEQTPEKYVDGSEIWWRWKAQLKILSRSGFVPRPDLLHSLGYLPNWNLRGFGKLHSGLLEISPEQYEEIIGKFRNSRRLELKAYPIPRGTGQVGGVGESAEHKRLKQYVANHPAAALREPGMRTVRLEFPFPTGDRADVVLADAYDRVVAVEVETTVGSSDVVGPLQAIKYRFMLEWLSDREPGDSRGGLVAHSIAPAIQKLCHKYSVECIEIPEDEVRSA